MNNITIAGPLGRDAEERAMPDGTPVLSFSVADSQGREKPSIWWACQLFGKRAQSLRPYLVKGQQVTVSGTVTEREWSDKQGQPRKTIEIRVADVALQGGKPQQTEQRQAPPPKKNHGSGFDDMDDSIPF